jgi:hypothetical protein
MLRAGMIRREIAARGERQCGALRHCARSLRAIVAARGLAGTPGAM